MKIKSMFLVAAASLAFTSQSFAGDLLDRMLGMGGCGCAPSCCDAPAAGPGCGSDAATASACCDPCARPRLVDFRFRINWSAIPRPNLFNRLGACDTGCDTGCDSGCDSGCDTGCAAPAGPSCGNNGPVAADPSCGNNGPIAADPSCGCNGAAAAAPSCGVDATDCGCGAVADPCCRPSLNLLGRLGNLRARIASRPRLLGGCCDTAASCCDAGPASCCGSAPACGTDAPIVAAPAAAAPVQPVPAAE